VQVHLLTATTKIKTIVKENVKRRVKGASARCK